MQVTIELTQKEYEQIEKHVKIAIVMKPANIAKLSTTDQVLRRLCLAVIQDTLKEKIHEQPTTQENLPPILRE